MNYTNIFPSNLLGTHANFVEPTETNNIFICGDYHGRYEDDDCDFLFFNKETNEFWMDFWTTRGYCTNSPWNVPCVDINRVTDEALIETIKSVAKEKILSDMDKIRKGVVQRMLWSAKGVRKAGIKKAEEVLMGIDYTDDINAIDNLPQLISFFYSHDSIKKTCGDFYIAMMNKYANDILVSNMKKLPAIKLYGKDYTGEIFMLKDIDTRFGIATKVGINCGDNKVYALLNRCGDAHNGDTITINGTINEEYSHDNVISLSSARRIDNIDPARIVRCGDAANTDTTTDNSANATDKTDNADTTDTKTDKVAAKKKDMPMTQVYANVAKETEKAYQFNVAYWTKIDQPQKNATMWCPKSCCTITEKEEVFIADFILNKWVADYEERIRQHTSRIPNVMFDVTRIESAKANEEDKN